MTKVDSAKTTKRSSAWGMCDAEYRAHVAEFGSSAKSDSPMRRYFDQRTNAQRRGIAWNFTFADWWKVWSDSGKWELRGRGHGYVMARHGDGNTAYSKETVYICTATQNVHDSFVNTPASVRVNRGSAPGRVSERRGLGRGWTFDASCGKNPYRAQFGRQTIGYFPTAEQARAAYLAAVAAKP